ncbi:MAG: transposase [Leptolyngbyaceae cyanobacterium]
MCAKYDPDKYHRRSIRLKNYDYATPGSYFVTLCAQNRACLFGAISDYQMRLNDAGQMVREAWMALPQRFPKVKLDASVVMPNHFHGVITFQPTDIETVGAPLVGALDPSTDKPSLLANNPSGDLDANDMDRWRVGTRPTPIVQTSNTVPNPTLGDVVGTFKSITTHRYAMGVRHQGWPPFEKRLWQRNYYEHIIRDETVLQHLRQYIEQNPQMWAEDQLHPDVISKFE